MSELWGLPIIATVLLTAHFLREYRVLSRVEFRESWDWTLWIWAAAVIVMVWAIFFAGRWSVPGRAILSIHDNVVIRITSTLGTRSNAHALDKVSGVVESPGRAGASNASNHSRPLPELSSGCVLKTPAGVVAVARGV